MVIQDFQAGDLVRIKHDTSSNSVPLFEEVYEKIFFENGFCIYNELYLLLSPEPIIGNHVYELKTWKNSHHDDCRKFIKVLQLSRNKIMYIEEIYFIRQFVKIL